jgi:hypothetical protein
LWQTSAAAAADGQLAAADHGHQPDPKFVYPAYPSYTIYGRRTDSQRRRKRHSPFLRPHIYPTQMDMMPVDAARTIGFKEVSDQFEGSGIIGINAHASGEHVASGGNYAAL